LSRELRVAVNSNSNHKNTTMRTKDEILKEVTGLEDWEASEYELQAMDSFAKQTAVAFAIFIRQNTYIPEGVTEEEFYEELFNQFITSQNP
jgi:hypothetical protein